MQNYCFFLNCAKKLVFFIVFDSKITFFLLFFTKVYQKLQLNLVYGWLLRDGLPTDRP